MTHVEDHNPSSSCSYPLEHCFPVQSSGTCILIMWTVRQGARWERKRGLDCRSPRGGLGNTALETGMLSSSGKWKLFPTLLSCPCLGLSLPDGQKLSDSHSGPANLENLISITYYTLHVMNYDIIVSI